MAINGEHPVVTKLKRSIEQGNKTWIHPEATRRLMAAGWTREQINEALAAEARSEATGSPPGHRLQPPRPPGQMKPRNRP